MWNGNQEQLRNLFSWNPERSRVRWTYTRYVPTRSKFLDAMNDPRWSHLRFVHLQTRSEIDQFVDAQG